MSFADLAQTRVGDVERPKAVPAGHYRGIITGPFKEHKAKSGNFAMRFPVKVTQPTDDIDADDLENAGGLPEKEVHTDFWMSPDARWRFTEFAKSLGVGNDSMTLIELGEAVATCGEEFTIEAVHNANEKDPEAPPFVRWENPVGDASTAE